MILSRHTLKTIIIALLLGISVLISLPVTVLAQADCVNPDGSTPGVTVQPGIGGVQVCPIRFPLFMSLDQAKHFSVYSYISLAMSLVFVLLVTYWIFRIIANAVAIMQSQGDSGKISEAVKRIQSIFIGVATIFIFVAVFSVIGLFFNLGTLFEWPKKLSLCTSGEFYVTKALEMNTSSEAEVDLACFGR